MGKGSERRKIVWSPSINSSKIVWAVILDQYDSGLSNLYTILQRFEYHICIINFSVGKCLSNSSRYKVNNKNQQH